MPTEHSPDQITGARFRLMRESLGFTGGAFAKFAHVQADSVNDWDSGRSHVPRGVVRMLYAAAAEAGQLVEANVARLHNDPAPTLITYRSDNSYQAAEPDAIYPATWHRMVAARIADRIPGLHLAYV